MEHLECQVQLDLAKARATFKNPGERGTAMEKAIADALRRHLPLRFGTGHGEVIDSHGRRSRQVDVVIVDETHPFTFEEGGQGLFFIEGVVVGCEVKSCLRSGDLDNELEKAIAFKALRPRTADGFTLCLPKAHIGRYYERRPYVLIAAESDVPLDRLRDQLEEKQQARGLAHADFIDAVFIVGGGALMNLGEGDEAYCVSTAAHPRLRGWVGCTGAPALGSALGWFYCVTPNQWGRTPPVTFYFLAGSKGTTPAKSATSVVKVHHGTQPGGTTASLV